MENIIAFKMEELADQLLQKLNISHYTDRHRQIALDFLSNEEKVKNRVSCLDTCEDFLSQLGEHTYSDLQKVQGFVEAHFC